MFANKLKNFIVIEIKSTFLYPSSNLIMYIPQLNRVYHEQTNIANLKITIKKEPEGSFL